MIEKFVKLKFMILSGVVTMSTANATSETLKIRSVFDINSSFCAIKTNGVLGMDNRDSSLEGRGFGSSSTNTMMVLENGENDITVEIGSLGWFSLQNISDNERKLFKPDAGCKVALTAFKGKEAKILSELSITIDKDGIPVARSTIEDEPAGKEKITVKKISAQQVEDGHLPSNYLINNYFPKGMELYQFTTKVYLKGLPEWKWTKATPFTGKPEQIQALKLAYLDLWNLFAAKNSKAIKSSLRESLHAWSLTTGSSVDEIYNDYDIVYDLKKDSFKMNPVNWADYKIDVINNGRMVRLVNKSDPTISPLWYTVKDEDGDNSLGGYSPVFSLVDGRFIPVI